MLPEPPSATTPYLIGILGPTGSGKSAVAEWISDHYGFGLLNADAFQMYRGFNIGTNKPDQADRYALMDQLDPDAFYGVGQYVQEASAWLREALPSKGGVVVVGGTGLYVRALFEGYSNLGEAPPQELREDLSAWLLEKLVARLRVLRPDLRVDWNNRVRVQRALERELSPTTPVQFKLPNCRKAKVILDVPVETLDARLLDRTHELIKRGWIEEVRELLASGISPECPAFRAIGYSAVSRFLDGDLNLEELVESVQMDTRRYAKRQRSWLRREPNAIHIPWDPERPLDGKALVPVCEAVGLTVPKDI